MNRKKIITLLLVLSFFIVGCIAPNVAEAAKVPWYKEAAGKKVKVKVDMPWGCTGIRG